MTINIVRPTVAFVNIKTGEIERPWIKYLESLTQISLFVEELPAGQVFIGNGSSNPISHTISGEATLSSTGVLTVAASHSGSTHASIQAAAEATAASALSGHVAASDPHTGYRLESADHTHQSTGLQGGQLDHGLSLTGLTDDDHTQYLLASAATDRSTFATNWTDLTDGGKTTLHLHDPRVSSTASSATPTPNADTTDLYILTALSEAAAFGIPTGTPVQGQALTIRLKDNATGRALSFNAIYRGVGVTLPTTTVSSKTMYLTAKYNSTDVKWDVLTLNQEA